MIKKNQRFFNLINVLSDAFLIFVSYFFAIFIRFDVLNGYYMLEFTSGFLLRVDLYYSLLVVFFYYIFHLYDSQRVKKVSSKYMLIYLINGIGTLGLASMLYLLRVQDFSRILLFLFWIIASSLVWLKHGITRLLLFYYRSKGYNQKHIIVVGSGNNAIQYAQYIKNNPKYGFIIDGYIGRKTDDESLGRHMGELDNIVKLLSGAEIDDLIVALDAEESIFMRDVLKAADKEGLRVDIIPFYNEYYPAHPTIETLGDSKLINLRATPLDNIGSAIIKRFLDIVGSIFFIILFSPVMIIIAVGVKVTSPGPILFTQERIGRNKKTFKMLKFRSMRVDVDHTGWSTDEDNRKTKFGSFIRKCSLDELPQFFNVLVGQMSIVGPRPELPKFVMQFKEEIPLYLVRQQVRPGITGLSQVSGLRGNTSIEERVKTDVWYIENWSLGLDFKIILKTIFGGMINSEKVR